MPELRSGLLREKRKLLEQMLDVANEQLTQAADGGEEALVQLSAATESRFALMAAVEAVDGRVAGAEADDELLVENERAAIRALLGKIDERDVQTQDFLRKSLEESGMEMRAARKTHQGIHAYMSTQNTAGGLFIDEKK